MNPDTGEIYENLTELDKNNIEKKSENKLIPLTEKQVTELKPLSNRKRKWLMKNGVCICGSGKSFKKCCWKKYSKKK